MSSWPNHALALALPKNASPRDQFFAFIERYQNYPGELERTTSAPFQEVVVDKDVNLFEKYPKAFQLDPKAFANLATIPAITPRRS